MKAVDTGRGEREIRVRVWTAFRAIGAGEVKWLKRLRRGDLEKGLEE